MRKISLLICVVLSIQPVSVFADILIWRMSGGNPQREGLFTTMPQPPLTLLWKSQTGLELQGSVLTDGQKLFVAGNSAHNGVFACLDWQTGNIEWKKDISGKCLSSPVIADNGISIASTDGRIYGVGLDGKTAFSVKTPFRTCTNRIDPMDTGENLVFCLEDYGAGVFAINPKNNEKSWEVIRYSSNNVKSSPCADAGLIYVAYNDDFIEAISETDNKIAWEREVADGITGNPIVCNGRLILPTKKGAQALTADNGIFSWATAFEENYNPQTTPATDGRLVFFSTSNRIYALDSQSGQIEWSQKFENILDTVSSPSVASGLVCVHDGKICYLYKTDTGERVSRFEINTDTVATKTIGQPLILWDRIIFTTKTGTMVCWGILGDNPQPEPEPQPDPPKEDPVPKSTLRINAPEKAYLGDVVEIAIELVDAKNWTNGQFVFVFDNSKLEFVGAKPGELLISQNTPLELKTEPGEFGANITASITKAEGITGNGVLAYIALKPKDTGKHNLTIIDAKMTDTARKTHEPNIEPDSFMVEEKPQPDPEPKPDPEPQPEPQAEFILEPKQTDLGVLTNPKSVELVLVQKNGKPNSYIVRSSGDFGDFTPKSGSIQPNSSQKINVTVSPANLKPGDYDLVMSVNVLDKTLTSTIKFKIPDNTPPPCIDILPGFLDFGYIPRGREVSINFIINLDIDEEISGVIETDKPWLKVSPVVFKTRSKRIEGIATISASELPGGDSFEGHLVIKTKNNVCKEVKVVAKVKTQPSILLEMDIGVPNAKIASFTVPLDYPPFIRNNRTLVPIRFVSEAFGCKVQWEATTKKITITRFTDTITLWVGQKQALVNGQEVDLDVAPSLENSTTFVPIRFISEAFGAKVEWFPQTRHIKITYTPPEDYYP